MYDESLYIWAPAYNWIARGVAKHQMERKVAAIIAVANGHEASGESAGSAVYRALLEQADTVITGFSDKWQLPKEKVLAQLPMMGQLRRLAEASPPKSSGSWVVFGLLAALAIPIAFAIWNAIYQHVLHWLGGH